MNATGHNALVEEFRTSFGDLSKKTNLLSRLQFGINTVIGEAKTTQDTPDYKETSFDIIGKRLWQGKEGLAYRIVLTESRKDSSKGNEPRFEQTNEIKVYQSFIFFNPRPIASAFVTTTDTLLPSGKNAATYTIFGKSLLKKVIAQEEDQDKEAKRTAYILNAMKNRLRLTFAL